MKSFLQGKAGRSNVPRGIKSKGKLMSTAQRRRMRLGELLVSAGVLDENRLSAALDEQRKWGGKLGTILLDMGFINEPLMVKALSRQLGLEDVDIESISISPDITGIIERDICERYGVIPVSKDLDKRILKVATSDPTNYQALDAVASCTNFKVEPMVASAGAIDRAIRKYYLNKNESGRENTLSQAEASRQAPSENEAVSKSSFESRSVSENSRRLEMDSLEKQLRIQSDMLRKLIEDLTSRGIIEEKDYR